MTRPPEEIAEDGVLYDRACAGCGHTGHAHLVREAEVPGDTRRDTFCEECAAYCEFVPDLDDQ